MPTSDHLLIIAQQILAFISFFTNGLLIILIVLKSPIRMGSYKYLIIFMSAFDIVYGAIDLLVKPEVHTRGSYYATATTSERSILPLVVAYPLMLLWAASFGIALALFAIHFLYRYFIVTGNKNYITGVKKFCLWMTIPLFSGLIYGVSIHKFFEFGTEMDKFARTDISKDDGISKEDVIYYGFSLYKYPGLGEIDWNPIYGTIVMSAIVVNLSTNTSSLSKTLQTQLFYSLVLQASIPILLIYIPSTLIVVSTFFGTAYEFYGQLITITIAVFPAIDALPSLIIVRPYREAIRDWLKLKFSSTTVGTLDQIPSSTVSRTMD